MYLNDIFRIATLLPWNFFITPFAYWMTKLQRTDWKQTRAMVEHYSELSTASLNISSSGKLKENRVLKIKVTKFNITLVV